MLNLVVLAVSLITGILLGYFVREKKRFNLNRIIFGFILALIFSLGFSIGSNNELLGLLPRVGLNAVIILLLSVFFSVVFVWAAVKAD
ncbi:LysO family transporter [Candidatus Bathyarchaeota archaeon]|nr:LysO family transporter [Candidatus Bathyarchaeota archaeon]